MKILKGITAIILLLVVSTAVSAQTVNDQPISSVKSEYIEIVGMEKAFSNKIVVSIQFGQEDKLFSAKDTVIKDENGKRMEFNSMIDAMNFCAKQGYVFQDAYAVSIGNQNVYHYLMKKE